MKKLFFILSIMFISITPSFAEIGPFTIDLFGAYVGAGDMENQFGLGGGLGMGITDNTSILFRVINTEKSTKADPDFWDESNYQHFSLQIGVEYVPVIPLLEKYRLTWNSSLLVGRVESDCEYYKYNTAGGYWQKFEYHDSGYGASLWTGLHFNYTQYISLFLEVGYHYDYYEGELQDASINGFQALIGARCTLFGVKDYADGY